MVGVVLLVVVVVIVELAYRRSCQPLSFRDWNGVQAQSIKFGGLMFGAGGDSVSAGKYFNPMDYNIRC